VTGEQKVGLAALILLVLLVVWGLGVEVGLRLEHGAYTAVVEMLAECEGGS
jgi:hypothetical protein